jgi:superoxide dismutase
LKEPGETGKNDGGRKTSNSAHQAMDIHQTDYYAARQFQIAELQGMSRKNIEEHLELSMWEHAFVYDYPTSEEKKYVEALFENLSWIKVEARFGKTDHTQSKHPEPFLTLRKS